MAQEPTNKDISDKIDKYTDTTEKRFEQTEKRFDQMEIRFDDLTEAIQEFATHVEKKFDNLETEVNTIKATMVTKNYLDDKLADLKGDLIVLIRKEDNKIKALITILEKNESISGADASKILAMDPFPQNM